MRVFENEWIFQAFENDPSFFTKRMFGGLAAYLFGRWPLGMSGHELLAVTVIAALPTAQTVFLLAAHYRQGVLLARDSAFVSTLLAVPVILVITALLS